MAPDRILALAVNRLPRQGSRAKARVWARLRDGDDVITSVAGGARALKEAEGEARRLEALGIRFTTLGDADYPPLLAHIADPPFLLYWKGTLPPLEKSAVAVVGTRRPNGNGFRQAYRLGLELALSGYPVISGLAFGVDKAAHQGCLDGHGRTWAVLAGGLDRPSPMTNRSVAARILANGGGLIGEVEPGVSPQRYAFPRRNRILSGLCRGCVVVQAPIRSGALITAELALDQGRDVYVASSGIQGGVSAGTRKLADEGAPVIEGAADVLADWGRYMDIRSLRPLEEPQSGRDLAAYLDRELQGRIYRHWGGYFERCRA